MAATGQFFLTVCFALLLTVRALECYTKVEYDCSPDGPTCDALESSLGNRPMTPTTCDDSVTMCSLTTVSASVQGFELESAEARCLPQEEGVVLTNGCYDRKELEKLDPNGAEQLKQLEQSTGATFDNVEICICDKDLCNGSIKSVFSMSVIILSVVTGFVLSI